MYDLFSILGISRNSANLSDKSKFLIIKKTQQVNSCPKKIDFLLVYTAIIIEYILNPVKKMNIAKL